jgi:hypothetical protein
MRFFLKNAASLDIASPTGSGLSYRPTCEAPSTMCKFLSLLAGPLVEILAHPPRARFAACDDL